MYTDDIVHSFNDEIWLAFHQGEINNFDEYYEYKRDWIDNAVIYTHKCKEIIDELNYDVFEDHDLFGRAENYHQAAFSALYDLLNDHDDVVRWDEMEEVLNEA